jgi:hypothetical protein
LFDDEEDDVFFLMCGGLCYEVGVDCWSGVLVLCNGGGHRFYLGRKGKEWGVNSTCSNF